MIVVTTKSTSRPIGRKSEIQNQIKHTINSIGLHAEGNTINNINIGGEADDSDSYNSTVVTLLISNFLIYKIIKWLTRPREYNSCY